MTTDRRWMLLCIAGGLLLFFGGGIVVGPVGPVGGDPFPTTLPAAAMITYDGRAEVRKEFTDNYSGVAGYVQAWAAEKKGEFRLVDVNDTVGPAMDAEWVKAAFAVADKTNIPSIVVATPTKGIKPTPLPRTVADATALLQAL